MKKIKFNDLTEIEIQDYEFDGAKVLIKSLSTQEVLLQTFSNPLKTRKMTVLEDDQELTELVGFTELYSLIDFFGGMIGVQLFKKATTPEQTALVMNDMVRLARLQAITLSDNQAVLVPNLYDPYEEKDYKRDDRVLDNGVLYKALHDITPTHMQGKTPSEMPTLWSKVLGESGIEPWEQPDSTNGYKRGSKVTHNGKTWESLQDNNVWEPGTVGAPWKEVNE